MSRNADVLHPKIRRLHLQRKALVYVRQSSLQQLHRHQESTRLQYALVERARQLGWPAHQIEVIDDDLGRSGATAEGRPGFQRLVAEVGLNLVGIIIGLEMSRLARSCRDWHQLLEICSLFRTLIADNDGIYEPADYNDRLLLGLKGTMSEAELHLIKQRMHAGRLAKARRGELHARLPMGYLRRPSGEVIKDPDEGVRAVIEALFEQFPRQRSINGLLHFFVEQRLKLPVREYSGPCKGELSWRRPCRQTLQFLLKNPIYAGAYVYGRRPVDPRRKQPGRPSTGRVTCPTGQWEVFLPNRLPAYISWATYLANQEQLRANRAQYMGRPRSGPSRLCGLLHCGRCGRRMAIQYSNGRGRYVCARAAIEYADPVCQGLVARVLDQAIEELVLRALEPAALTLSLQVAGDLEAERARLDALWAQRVERARYEAERAGRQFNAVEPENRLVARTLEHRWEETLAAQGKLEAAWEAHQRRQPSVLTAAERTAVCALAEDIPALWRAETTTVEDQMEIVRLLIDRVEAEVLNNSERVRVRIVWAGGHQTEQEIVRPVARLKQLSYYHELLARVEMLRTAGSTWPEIADRLNQEGWRPAKRRETFNSGMLRAIASRLKKTSPVRRQGRRRPTLGPNEWWIDGLAAELKMPTITLYNWIQRGWVRAEKRSRMWVISADDAERARLRHLRAAPSAGWRRRKHLSTQPEP